MPTVEWKPQFRLRYRSFLHHCRRGNHRAPQQLFLLQIDIICSSLFCWAQEEPIHHASVTLAHLWPSMTSHLWRNRLLAAFVTGFVWKFVPAPPHTHDFRTERNTWFYYSTRHFLKFKTFISGHSYRPQLCFAFHLHCASYMSDSLHIWLLSAVYR